MGTSLSGANAIASLSPAFSVLSPILLGITLGIASRPLIHQSRARETFARVLNDLALKVLLPFFVIESLIKVELSLTLLFAIAIGFIIPLSTFAGMQVYKLAQQNKPYFPRYFSDLQFVASTFGGGSRGTAILVLLFASSSNFGEYMKWFALIDFGNFLCLLTVIKLLMKRHYGGPQSNGETWLNKLLQNYAFIALLIAILYFVLRTYFPKIDSVLGATVNSRRLLFSTLVFWAITIQFNANAMKGFFADAVALLLGRVFAAVVVILPLMFLFPNHSPLLIATAILLLMPPSSLVPAMVENAGASPKVSAYVSSFTGAANISYVLLVALGVVVLFAHLR